MGRFEAGGRAALFGGALLLACLGSSSDGIAGKAHYGGALRPGGGTRVYILRGLGDELTSSAVDEVGTLIRSYDPRIAVQVENWHDWEDILSDAASHPGDRIVLVGFSLGARSAGLAANALAARGIHVKVVGLDPACADAAVDPDPHIRAVSFYRTTCGDGGRMRGARNVRIGGPSSLGIFGLLGHTEFPSLPLVQRLVVREVLSDDAGAARWRERR